MSIYVRSDPNKNNAFDVIREQVYQPTTHGVLQKGTKAEHSLTLFVVVVRSVTIRSEGSDKIHKGSDSFSDNGGDL